MINEKICVTIKGKTFEAICEDNLKADDEAFNSYAIDKICLIKEILDKISVKTGTKGIVVGHSKNTGNNNLKLYSEFNDSLFYGGIGGVLHTPVTVSLPIKSDSSEATVFKKVVLDVKLQITTKFDVSEKPYFLATMLLYDKLTLSNNTVPSNEDDIYDYMLLFWFKEQLQKACLKGLFKTYRYFERNDEKLRGTIDIARHIKLNLGQNNGKIAYRYRENTTNNYLNYLIVAAYTHLKEKYYDLVVENIDSNFDLLSVINQLKNDTGYIRGGLKNIISKNLRAITHPLYTEYEELRITSIRILRDEGLSIFDGEEDEAQGMLFYVPDLWENFVENSMKKYIGCLKDNTVKLSSQTEIYVLSKPNAATNKNNKDNFFFTTRPDYVFFNTENHKEQPLMVLDAKFRPGWQDVIYANKIDSSLSGDYDKCLRDMCDFGVHCTGVIFPFNVSPDGDADKAFVQSSENNSYYSAFEHTISCYNNRDSNRRDSFYTIPIRIPESDKKSYSDWQSEFDRYIEKDIKAVDYFLKELISDTNT